MPFQADPANELPHEETIDSRIAWESRFVTVRVDDVRLPSGRDGERVVVQRTPSVVVIPVTAGGDVLLIRQYRHAAGQHLVELPAGLVDPGEDALATARRELVEETGHEPGTMQVLAEVFMSPGFTDERTTFVLAEGCRPVEHNPDPDEPIRIARVPLDRIPDLLVPGEPQVIQAQAMLGLLWLLRLKA